MATDTIYALFHSMADAERAIGALIDHGISRDDIGVVARKDGNFEPDLARVNDPRGADMGEPIVSYVSVPGPVPPTGAPSMYVPIRSVEEPENVEDVGKDGITTTTAEDALAGAAVGAGVGLIAGLLASAVALTIPGVGIILAGGVLASAIGATAATTAAGAVVGGAVGYLRDMGMTEHAAASAAERIDAGAFLVSIRAELSQRAGIQDILAKYNAFDVEDNPIDPNAVAISSRPTIITEQLDGTPIVPAYDVPAPISQTGAYLEDEPFDDDPLDDETVIDSGVHHGTTR